MPRRNRCLLPGVPCHVTARGVDRRSTFLDDSNRGTYLQLLRQHLGDAKVRLLAWCLMNNHIHLIALPEREESLSLLLGRVQGRYAQYFNAHAGRTGHLWQRRFFGCMLGSDHLWRAIVYVERNPVRAGMVKQAGDYRWSSAVAHLTGQDADGILDMEWWRREGLSEWAGRLGVEDEESVLALRECTYAGRPYADEDFVEQIARRFGRYWKRGRPKKEKSKGATGEKEAAQISLF